MGLQNPFLKYETQEHLRTVLRFKSRPQNKNVQSSLNLSSLTVDSRSSFFSPKPHRKACYAGYINWGIVISWLLPVKFDRYGIPVREASFLSLFFFIALGVKMILFSRKVRVNLTPRIIATPKYDTKRLFLTAILFQPNSGGNSSRKVLVWENN